ncbi:MAG: hypothetical protein ACJA1Z_003461 [Patiriisocius sp.]|jgi:hypothetical protein
MMVRTFGEMNIKRQGGLHLKTEEFLERLAPIISSY